MAKLEKVIGRLRDMSNMCANRGEIQSMRTLDDAIAFLRDKAEHELSEDCEDCQEYDTEKHYCPRFCKVIRETVDELNANAPKWIAVTERLPECEVGAEIGNVEWISHDRVFAGCFGRGGKYRDAYFRTWTDTTEGIDAKDADCWRVVTLPELPKEEYDGTCRTE